MQETDPAKQIAFCTAALGGDGDGIYGSVSKLDPKMAMLFVKRAEARRKIMGHDREAAVDFHNAVMLDPNNASAPLGDAWAASWQQDPQRELDDTNIVIGLDPDNEEAHQLRAEAFNGLG